MVMPYADINTLRPRQNGRHFPDVIFKCNFLNENVWISSKMLLKFVPKGPTNNIPALVQIMAWRQPGDKPLSEPMLVSLPMHLCVTRPQWVKLDQQTLIQVISRHIFNTKLSPERLLYYHQFKKKLGCNFNGNWNSFFFKKLFWKCVG